MGTTLDWYQDPHDPNGPAVIYPQKGQTIKVVYGKTHTPGPDKQTDDCVIIKPKEQS